MTNHSVIVIILGKIAYIPTYGIDPFGARVNIEPIYKVEIDTNEMCKYVSKQLSTDLQYVNVKSEEDYKTLRNLLPIVTGTKTWKKLCLSGTSHSILRTPNNYLVSKSSLDEKGRWEYKKENQRTYPLSTNLETIITDIIHNST
jgi:hypothetical protein